MADELEITEPTEDPDAPEAPPAEPPPAIHDRFLFVNVSALRAKQLRRGALPRLSHPGEDGTLPLKPERIAMEEVRKQLVYYETPAVKGRQPEPQA